MEELRYQVDLLKAMNQKLGKREKMYDFIFDSSDSVYLYYNSLTGEHCVLGKWNEFFDFEMKEPKDFMKLFDLVDAEKVNDLREALYPEYRGEEYASYEAEIKRNRKWYLFRTHVTLCDGKCSSDKLVEIKNITKYKLQNDELAYFAYYDTITGLYNRNYFIRRLSDLLLRADETHDIVSVLMIDLDDFHKVNDALGMLVGDEVVQQFGSFIKENTNDNNVIACHLDRDVYCMAILAPDCNFSPEIFRDRLSEFSKKAVRLTGGNEVYLTASIGVAEYPEAANNPLELINCSEIVMLKSKSEGKNRMNYFDAPLLEDFMQSIEIENKLKDATYNKTFEMYYQPQYYADTGKLRGMEALIRWKDANEHYISPALFIPIAEKNGSILTIGRFVIEESIRQYASWKQKYKADLILSINVSARQYSQEDFVDHIMHVLKQYQVSPSEIEIEVTESILIEDFDLVTRKLKTLQNLGFRISLDDFGTGFSSLSYLKQLPINTLKIDKSFIDTILQDSATRIITESIIDMVKALGYESVAEGVEEEQQYKYLHAIGCDIIQGYLFSKPLPAALMEEKIAEI